jgi:short-subunit dehydrogenase
VYAATKAAVVSVTMSVSAEVPRGVRVHALCPDGVQTAMLDAQDKAALGSQLVHSGGRILTVDETADAAVALLGTRRVVRSLPLWRGGLVRASTLAPSVAKYGTELFAARGRKLIARRAGG